MGEPEEVGTDRAIDRFLILGTRLFRAAGIFLVAMFVLETISSLLELRLRNPALESRFISRMADQIPVLLLGLVLLFCHPRYLTKKAEAWFLSWLSYAAMFVMAFYLLAIPIKMNAAIQIFRNNSFQVGERIKVQLERAKKVQETTLALSPEQQEQMVTRYNRANPRKKPIDVAEFLQLLDEEIKIQQAKLEQERKALLDSQQRSLYASQLLETCKCLLGAAGFFLVWKHAEWARPAGQKRLRPEHEGRKRWTY